MSAVCGRCGGIDGRHGLVHARHETGGGGVNRPCPNGSDPRELDYGPVGVGDRVIVAAPGGRAGSAKARANGCEGTVTKAGPKNLTIELDEGRTIIASRSLVLKNNSGRKSAA